MFTVNEKTTFVGLTDLRAQGQKMLLALKDSRVILTHRNRPQAVILKLEDYQLVHDLLEMAEEMEIASIIKKRKKHNKGEFLTLEKLLSAFS